MFASDRAGHVDNSSDQLGFQVAGCIFVAAEEPGSIELLASGKWRDSGDRLLSGRAYGVTSGRQLISDHGPLDRLSLIAGGQEYRIRGRWPRPSERAFYNGDRLVTPPRT